MTQIYENILIGNFLFVLGMKVGERNGEFTNKLLSINLLQQTPADTKIGDLFASLGGKNIIIEFKRDLHTFRGDKKEAKKIDLLKKRLESNVEMTRVSRKAHMLAYGEFLNVPNICIQPYLQYRTSNVSTMDTFIEKLLKQEDAKQEIIGDINEETYDEFKKLFAEIDRNLAVIDSDNTIGCNDKEINAYIELLKETNVGSTGAKSGGIIMNFRREGIQYLAFPDILNLSMTLEEMNAVLEAEDELIQRRRRTKDVNR